MFFSDKPVFPLKSGVKFSVIRETLESPFKEHFPAYYKGLVRGEPGGFVLHPKFVSNADKIYNMTVRSTDLWIRTFPRSGMTWTSELAWLIMNDCNFSEALEVPLSVRSPTVDTNYFTNWDDLAPSEIMDARHCQSIEKMEQLPSPRILKSHLPFHLLPPRLLNTAKVIFVVRNPKDAIVSFFHFHKLVKLCYFAGEMNQFVDYFIDNKVAWTPYFSSVLDAWGKRNHPNLLILFYEDMIKDLRAQIEKMATFLNRTVTEEQIGKLVDHVRVDSQRDRPNISIKASVTNNDCLFIRQGKTNDWKNYFSPEVNVKIDEWIKNNLDGSDLNFATVLQN